MQDDSQSNVTVLLTQAADGSRAAKEQLFRLVSNELRKMADQHLRRERPGHTLQPTILVDDVFLRLVGDHANIDWQDRNHFFRAATRAMRQMLVDYERRRRTQKRGGDKFNRVDVEPDQIGEEKDPFSILALNEALDKLATVDSRQADVVQFHHFGGRTLRETAELLEVSVETVKLDWRMARAWLFRELKSE